jgi:hypothetical protein
MKTTFTVFLALLFLLTSCEQGPKVERYQSYQTQNMWTQLLLDTRTGKVWQVSKSQDGGTTKLPINATDLVRSSRNGRFRLDPMPNMWNFMLTDTESGKMWRCQYSMDDPKMRYIEPVQ